MCACVCGCASRGAVVNKVAGWRVDCHVSSCCHLLRYCTASLREMRVATVQKEPSPPYHVVCGREAAGEGGKEGGREKKDAHGEERRG